MTVINTNVSGLIGLNNLRLTNLGLRQSLARLSSGLRINWAADDPSGLAIGKGMEAQIGGIRMATQNAEDGINLIHTADGALAETQDILLRMRDLAVRASNQAPLTTNDRTRLDNEFTSLKLELERKSHAVTFNTQVLFSGSFSSNGTWTGQTLQIGPDNTSNFRLTVKIASLGLSSLKLGHFSGGQIYGFSMVGGVATYGPTALSSDGNVYFGNGNVRIGSHTAAQSAIDWVQSALNQVSDVRSLLGIQERRLYHMIDDLAAEDINISAAKSRIMDADMAVEISEFTRLQILQQTGTAILAQANAQPQSILQLMQ